MSCETMDYQLQDEVKIGCNDCAGCQKCCEKMGDSIVLDPYDIWLLTKNLRIADGQAVTFEILVSEDGPLTFTNRENLLLPCIKMVEPGQCPFLSEKGRCSIHKIRPGLCRLYPLGRSFYEDHLSYFVLEKDIGCPSKMKEPVRISKWLGIEDPAAYENFIFSWHSVRKNLSQALNEGMQNKHFSQKQSSALLVSFLTHFYAAPYGNSFYAEYEKRVERWKCGLLMEEEEK